MSYDNLLIEVPEGWHKIVLKCHEMLIHMDPSYQVEQVKEKYGGLRYYYSSEKQGVERKIMDAIISSAEREADFTCQECGKTPATISNGGWVATLCSDCRLPR